MSDVMTLARQVCDEFNQKHGRRLLQLAPNLTTRDVFDARALMRLEDIATGLWVTAREAHRMVHMGNPPTHGDAVCLGRQLGRRYESKRDGALMLYHIKKP